MTWMPLFGHDKDGREVADEDRVALPPGWQYPESLTAQIQRMVRLELSRQAGDEGYETFEESDDFDVDDDESMPESPYEVKDMTPEGPYGTWLDPSEKSPGVKEGEAGGKTPTSGAPAAPSVSPGENPTK